jgi:hypothetical protein
MAAQWIEGIRGKAAPTTGAIVRVRNLEEFEELNIGDRSARVVAIWVVSDLSRRLRLSHIIWVHPRFSHRVHLARPSAVACMEDSAGAAATISS